MEIKAKICENDGHFEIQGGHQKNNDQLPPRELIAILSMIKVSNATFLNSPGSSEAQIKAKNDMKIRAF